MEINGQQIDKPTCCIIRLQDGTVNPNTLYQVVLDPEKVSPGGAYHRFTQDNLCEVHGWKPLDAIEIMELLETVEKVADKMKTQ